MFIGQVGKSWKNDIIIMLIRPSVTIVGNKMVGRGVHLSLKSFNYKDFIHVA